MKGLQQKAKMLQLLTVQIMKMANTLQVEIQEAIDANLQEEYNNSTSWIETNNDSPDEEE